MSAAPISPPNSDSYRRWLAVPAVFSALAAAAVAVVWARHTGAWMDTIHYVEAAEGLAQGGLPWISSPFYIARFLFGEGGRTLTEWPLLFPAAISLLVRLGVDGIVAARLWSALCFALLPFALWALARPFLRPAAAAAAVALSLCSAGLYQHATGGMSDTMALLFTVAGVACAARFGDSLATRPSRAAAYGAWLFLGAAAATRYAAAFVLPGVCAWLIFLALPARRLSWAFVWSSGLALLAVFPLLFKRYASVYPTFDRGPLSDLRTNVELAARHLVEDLFLGGWVAPGWLVALSVAAALALFTLAVKRTNRTGVAAWFLSRGGLCVLVAGSYIGLMIWSASHRTIDPLNTRYMMPAYPFLYIALVGALGCGRRLAMLSGVVVALSLAGAGRSAVQDLVADDFVPSPETIAWLHGHVAATDVVLTTDWHFARWLGRPVYQLPAYKWTGGTFAPADAALAAHAPRKVFLVVRRRDLPDATRGQKGEWGRYIKELVEFNEAPFARPVVALKDDLIYTFDKRWRASRAADPA